MARKLLTILGVLALSSCALVHRSKQEGLAQMWPTLKTNWTAPRPVTVSLARTTNADFHPPSGRLVYVRLGDSDADVWLQQGALAGLRPPRQLTHHTATDRWPRLDRTGSRVAFVSTREDVGGDIWLLRPDPGLLAQRLTRLTGPDSADTQPCWHPDGRRVFFASAPSLNGQFDLWELALRNGERARLTDQGGQMPDCSPDGRFLAFASRRSGDGTQIWILRLSDGARAQLTAPGNIDLYPCWDCDGRRVLFTRYSVDTSGDGKLSLDDRPSIFSVRFSPAIFADGEIPPARQLTSCASSDFAPRPFPNGFLYTSDRSGTGTDIWCLPHAGEVPDFERVSEYVRFARSAEEQGQDPRRRLLAWQNVLWAARSAAKHADVEFDLRSSADVAESYLKMGDAFLQLGLNAEAAKAFRSLVDEFPHLREQCGLARTRLMEMQRQSLSSAFAQELEPAWQEHLEKTRELLRRYDGYALQAESAGERRKGDALRRVCALAQLELALSYLARKRYTRALDALDEIPRNYSACRDVCARALLAKADVFRVLREPETVAGTYLKLLESYPDAEPYATRAARRAVEAVLGPQPSFKDKLTSLREFIEKHPHLPRLQALALNRIGDLFYERGDPGQAEKHYRLTIQKHADLPREAGAAYLALTTIQYEQGEAADAVKTDAQMQRLFGPPGGNLYERAKRAYVITQQHKARSDLARGDAAHALNIFCELARFDEGLAVAHRGAVDCYARLGRIEEAIASYQDRVAEDPRDHASRYALARAYSYYGPSKWLGNGPARRRRLAIDYYHQLRGFLFNRMALATDEPEAKMAALDSYSTALALSNPQEDPENHADLLFNVGEGYMLVEQYENAYRYYSEALKEGASFVGERGEAALEKIGRSAAASGDYRPAIGLLSRVLESIRNAQGRDGEQSVLLQREAQVLDELALVCQLAGDYSSAVGYYVELEKALTRLMERNPGAAGRYRPNLLRARRNLALNIYHAVEAGSIGQERLAEAYELLQDVLNGLARVGTVEWQQKKAPGLLTFDIRVASGMAARGAGFDADAERSLLYTYLGRISARAARYGDAARFLKKKLALDDKSAHHPPLPSELAQQAIVWSQTAKYLLMDGDVAQSLEAYQNAMELEERCDNLQGRIADCLSIGRILIRVGALPAEQRPMDRAAYSQWLATTTEKTRALLAKSNEVSSRYLLDEAAALTTNLAALSVLSQQYGTPASEDEADVR